MADTATTALTSAGTLDGTEVLYCVDGANSRKTTAQAVADLVTPASLSLEIGTDVQAYDANLPTWPAGVGATEVGYLNGVTSAIQTQLAGKQASNGNLDDLAGLSDPGEDAILFWDDSAGAYTHLTIGAGLTITDTEITSSGGGGGTPGGSSGQIQYNNGGSFGGSLLWQDTNIIEQRNSTSAQTLLLYNTFTDASNYERGFVRWNSNVFEIGTAAAGTGANRALTLNTAHNAAALSLQTGSNTRISITNSSAQFTVPAQPSSDLGTSLGSAVRFWSGVYAQDHYLKERATDPSDPAEGNSVIWQSDGTGAGDDGDIMIKITAGGVTKTATLVDFSAV